MEIPKHLRHLLLQRGGMERITRELATRNAIVERDNVVYSTQQRSSLVRDVDKNKGCVPCSTAIKTRDAFSRATSGRTSFWSLNDGSYLMGAASVRVVGEFGKRKSK